MADSCALSITGCLTLQCRLVSLRYLEAPFEEKWDEVARMIADKQFDELQKYEELGKEIALGKESPFWWSTMSMAAYHTLIGWLDGRECVCWVHRCYVI